MTPCAGTPSSTEDRSSPRAPSSSLSLGSYGMEIQCVCNAPPASPTRSSAPARPPHLLPIPPSSRSVVRGQKRSAWSSQHVVCLAHAALRSERSSLCGRRKPQGKPEVSSSHKHSGGNAARRGEGTHQGNYEKPALLLKGSFGSPLFDQGTEDRQYAKIGGCGSSRGRRRACSTGAHAVCGEERREERTERVGEEVVGRWMLGGEGEKEVSSTRVAVVDRRGRAHTASERERGAPVCTTRYCQELLSSP